MDRLFRRKPTPQELKNAKLAAEYTELTERLAQIRSNFDFVTESEAIDALIFEENAALARLASLYKEARASGARLEIYELKK